MTGQYREIRYSRRERARAERKPVDVSQVERASIFLGKRRRGSVALHTSCSRQRTDAIRQFTLDGLGLT